MPNHQILNVNDHSGIRVHTDAGAQYGDNVMASLVIPAEFRRLACEYPILFRHDPESRSFSALALFGFEPGENLFLEGDKWAASVRPLAMSIQPFLVGRSESGDGTAQVHIDMDHPRVSKDGNGMRLFDESGAPTPYVEEIAGMLGALDEGWRTGAAFFAALSRYDLLEPFSMDVQLGNGETHRLVGYHLVNEDKVRALEPAALADLHAGGHVTPMFMAIASLGNLTKLVNARNARRHG